MRNEDCKKRITIKEFRKLIGISQSKASKVLGLPLKTLQNWEQEIRSCPEWLEDIIVEKLSQWHEKDWEENAEKYMEEFFNNNYHVVYVEYGKQKDMEVDATGGTSQLRKVLDYWQGAYAFERCTAPTIISITTPKGKPIMETYIKQFNEDSEEITSSALKEMDHQNMDWAKPASTKEKHESMMKQFRQLAKQNN